MKEKKEKKQKKENGITLVALVVTIVILIILATVSINAVLGDNGLIKQAEKTKDLAENSILKEGGDMNRLAQEYANMIAEDNNPSLPEDTTPPTVNIVVGEVTKTSIAVTVNATDDSGEISSYKYYINGVEKTTGTTNSYTFTGLTSGTSYTIKVEAFDKAGNKGEDSTTASTTKPSEPTVEEKLKAGDYVTYPSAKGDLKCIVLYDNTSGYGVQLITSACVGSDITLGSSNFTLCKDSYNKAVDTLNEAAGEYNNSTYSTRARCVGSHTINISDNPGYFTSSYSYMSSYNGQFKNADENYKTDYEKMKVIREGIHNIGKNYWLASRKTYSDSDMSGFCVRFVNISGDFVGYDMCYVASGGFNDTRSNSLGLRPVFILKSGIKVTGGNGTESSPYTLGA